ncbi:MAG: MBL fold metallo-hydrolase [Burkholderiales bacterium]|nr:MBL fold metallo-hydrolase [Burkholderiales bacterium]
MNATPEKIIPGVVAELNPLVRRLTAPNPGVMTGPGTNTYIVGEQDLAVIDPGPSIDSHVQELIGAVGNRLRWIICTHTHLDHSPAAQALKHATGSQVVGMPTADDGRQDTTFAPDRVLGEHDTVDLGGCVLRAVHTPGHVANHLCYLLENQQLLFTGDHIMQGSTVVITPPGGDMSDYLASLAKLLRMDIAELAPGHGHVITRPHDEIRRLITHRLKREQKVLDAFAKKNPATLDELLPLVYDDVPAKIHHVARRSLHAHLIKLLRDERVSEHAGYWASSGSTIVP